VANVIPFTIDLTAHETTRLAAVLDCLRRGWHDTGVGHPKGPQHLFDVA
jgi:hypothetical protein